MKNKYYILPKLPYEYNALEPIISQELLTIHHDRHHQGYVNGANNILQTLDNGRSEGIDLDVKSTLKALSFNIGGHLLHSLFWPSLTSTEKASNEPSGELREAIIREFGSFEQFKKEFTQAAASVEGSGWAALSYCLQTDRPIIMQIEKHNTNVYPQFRILMVIDVWEHAYYLDYKNARGKFIENFWNIVNWNHANTRFTQLLNS
ncbi:MAG: superoxide dismutase [Candidatus Bathyarchaeota archaeon]|jgi:Fe-Mn family superoxide dismutase|nr:superoxide dismutase [Candidatus Bathyarchaeota archaeon]